MSSQNNSWLNHPLDKNTPRNLLNLTNLINMPCNTNETPNMDGYRGSYVSDARNNNNKNNQKTTVNIPRSTIIGLFSSAANEPPVDLTQINEPPPRHPVPDHLRDHDSWLRNVTNKFGPMHNSGGITLYADNKIKIKAAPNSLNYIIVSPGQIRYMKIVGNKIFLAEKTLYGFSEISYEYHSSLEQNLKDMIMLANYIIFVKMQDKLDKFANIRDKICSENIEDQIAAIKYTYPIICLYSRGYSAEIYICDSSYEYNASLCVKIDNESDFANISENKSITAKILVQYTIYPMYIICNNMQKKCILGKMSKLFQSIESAENSRHFSDAICLTNCNKKFKVE